MKRNLPLITMLFALAMSGLALVVQADPVTERDVKAAYLYNFASLTTWPIYTSNKDANRNVSLCVLGKDSFDGKLDALTKNMVGSVRISVRYLPNMQTVSDCQLLFIASSEQANATHIFNLLGKKPVLTVTDNLILFNAGAMIGLFLDNNRLVFDVNYVQIKNADLTISSKLLRVSRRVLQ